MILKITGAIEKALLNKWLGGGNKIVGSVHGIIGLLVFPVTIVHF